MIINNFEPTVGRKKVSDSFSEVLRESFEYFAESGIQMVSGYQDIISEEAMFEEYKNKMTTGLTADDAEQFEQIMENGRLCTLQESTISAMSPIAGLSMPTVRKMWVRTALKNAVPTETAKVPAFAISYMMPYIKSANQEKHYLPEALRDLNNELAEKARIVIQPNQTGTDKDGYITLPADNFDVFANAGGSLQAQDAIDPIFQITKVKVEDDGETHEVEAGIKLDLRGSLYGRIEYVMNDGTVKSDTLFGTVDLEKATITMTSIKQKIKGVSILAYYSSENNTRGESVGFDIKRKEVRIGTGNHLHAEMPIEWMQDNLALYNIDGTVEVVDLMSKTTAQKLDQQIRMFFEKSFDQSGSPFIGEFDVKPAAGFSGTPTDWRRELKTVIDYWATKLKQTSAFSQGYFVVMGNRMDINLLPDIAWQFRSIQGERAGVVVDYDLGATTYNNAFQIVASDNIPQGSLRMFFVPADNEHMSYKYYRATRCA